LCIKELVANNFIHISKLSFLDVKFEVNKLFLDRKSNRIRIHLHNF